jgi:hypothetical protein
VEGLLNSGTEVLSLISPEWRPVIVLICVGIGWSIAKKRGWVNGGQSKQDFGSLLVPISERLGAVELQVKTSLPKILSGLRDALEGDISATQELAETTRDVSEQLNRNVNTAVVVLTKIDGLRDILISLDAKIGTGGGK